LGLSFDQVEEMLSHHRIVTNAALADPKPRRSFTRKSTYADGYVK
jgi:hypothetical protein